MLWGTGVPVFIILNTGIVSTPPEVIELPHPSSGGEPKFPPDNIIHELYDGSRFSNHRGCYIYYEAYWDSLTKAQAEQIRQIINYSHSGYSILLKPHKDFSVSYKVLVNEEEGWNPELVLNKLTNGYEMTIICRGKEWVEAPNAKSDAPGYHDWTILEGDTIMSY